MSPAASDRVDHGTNLVWLQIAGLAILIAALPSPVVFFGSVLLIWGLTCLGSWRVRAATAEVRVDAER